MPEYSGTIQAKIDALELLTGAQRKPAEIVVIYWPAPTGTKVYAAAGYTDLPWWPNLAAAITAALGSSIPITLTLIPDGRAPFQSLPRTASIGDDSVTLTFSDLDDAFSALLMAYGEGIRVECFGYWPDPTVDLLLSLWRGHLHAPKEMNRERVGVTATAGFRSPQLLLPRRPHAVSCPFIFGALLDTQAEIDFHRGCPYNRHIGGSVGVVGFTDCPRRTLADCEARLATDIYWPSFLTRPDPIANNQTKGPNLLAHAYGNESNLNEPVRVFYGERYAKSLNLLSYRNELNNNNADEGFGAAIFEVGEGLMLALWDFRINGELVGAEHQQERLGTWGQLPTDWSPNVSAYSNTAILWGRILGDFTDAGAGDYSGSCRLLGMAAVRVYTAAATYTEEYTTNRMWCLLDALTHPRWGYGNDFSRYDIESAIEVAAWCDEGVALTDPGGNIFSGVRSTFNAELVGRATQAQIKDICTAGRIGLPFEFEGKDVFVALKAEDTDDPLIPVFTDEGASRNIVYDGARSSLQWSYLSDEEMTNQWTVNFDDATNAGVDTQLVFGDQLQQLRAGRAWGDRSVRVINKSQAAFGITNAGEASRLGVALLYLGPLDSGGILNPFQVKFTTWYSHTFNVRNYAIIKVTNAKLQAQMTAYFAARDLVPYAGVDYTCFRVMRYERKGDLRVEITAQMYATVEGGEGMCTAVREYAAADLTATHNPGDCPEVWPNRLSPGTHDLLEDPFANTCSDPDPMVYGEETDGTPYVEYTNGAYGFYGTWHDGFDIPAACAQRMYCAFELRSTNNANTGVLIGQTGGGFTGVRLTLKNGHLSFERTDGTVLATAESEVPTDSYAVVAALWDTVAGTIQFYYDDIEDGAQQYFTLGYTVAEGLGTIGRNSAGSEHLLNAKISHIWLRSPGYFSAVGGDTTGFSSPRNFAATVEAATGMVQFTWSPPLTGPHLVADYTLYESDGVTVIMPAALVYGYSQVFAVGTYTVKLRASDGAGNYSAYKSVTFTVPDPPAVGDDLYVIDDLTLDEVLDDLTLAFVTG